MIIFCIPHLSLVCEVPEGAEEEGFSLQGIPHELPQSSVVSLRPCQHFPILPQPPNEEQRENLQMLVPIAEWESVPEATVHTLRELGAFRLQVRLSLKVFPICKTVNTHLFRFPMSWTVHCGPYQHPIRQIVRGNDLVVGTFI